MFAGRLTHSPHFSASLVMNVDGAHRDERTRAVRQVFDENATSVQIKSMAYCVFPFLKTLVYTNHDELARAITLDEQASGIRTMFAASQFPSQALFDRMSRCVHCDDASRSLMVDGGLAALEYIHYCSENSTCQRLSLTREKVVAVPRACCFACAKKHAYRLPTDEHESAALRGEQYAYCALVTPAQLMRSMDAPGSAAITACLDSHQVMQYAARLSEECSCCSVSVTGRNGGGGGDDDDDGSPLQMAEHERVARPRRAVIDALLRSSLFSGMGIDQLHEAAEHADEQSIRGLLRRYECEHDIVQQARGAALDERECLRIVARFIENLSNALRQKQCFQHCIVDTDDSSDDFHEAVSDLVQIRYPFGGFVYQYRHQRGLFTFPKRHCTELCQYMHEYAVSQVVETTAARMRLSLDNPNHCRHIDVDGGDDSRDADTCARMPFERRVSRQQRRRQGRRKQSTPRTGSDTRARRDSGRWTSQMIGVDDVFTFRTLRNLERAFLAYTHKALVSPYNSSPGAHSLLSSALQSLARESNRRRSLCCACRDSIVDEASMVSFLAFVYCSARCATMARSIHESIFERQRRFHCSLSSFDSLTSRLYFDASTEDENVLSTSRSSAREYSVRLVGASPSQVTTTSAIVAPMAASDLLAGSRSSTPVLLSSAM